MVPKKDSDVGWFCKANFSTNKNLSEQVLCLQLGGHLWGKRCARSRLAPPNVLIQLYQSALPTRSSPPYIAKNTCRSKCSWCDQGDLNPHGCPYAPQTYASACSAMIANDIEYSNCLPVLCQALKRIFSQKYPNYSILNLSLPAQAYNRDRPSTEAPFPA